MANRPFAIRFDEDLLNRLERRGHKESPPISARDLIKRILVEWDASQPKLRKLPAPKA